MSRIDFAEALEKSKGAGGRPRIIDNPDEAVRLIQEYIDIQEESDNPKYTITGLAIHLGVARRSLYDYEKYPEFSHIIKLAQELIASKYEEKLSGPNAAGPIFALKNMGWSDRVETDNINRNVEMTHEEWLKSLDDSDD